MLKRQQNSFAIIGLGFGDEGKGVVTSSLARSLPNALVIRFSGGQQAGHTVTSKGGLSHVFSNFGSGSFYGVPTYWSRYCTFDPVGATNELEVLLSKGVKPVLYVDKDCPVTTPFDIAHNQSFDLSLHHGTCGVGVGATHEREENLYSLVAGDFFSNSILKFKLDAIRDYYKNGAILKDFLKCKNIFQTNFVSIVDAMPKNYHNYIFEGSQGLLLDQEIGFFPNVTRSNTSTKNIRKMGHTPLLYLVTRAFQTRHGNGPMTNLALPHGIKENPYETNVTNKFQGEFRKSLLDLELLKYGMSKENYISNTQNKQLVITCMDLMVDDYRYTIGPKVIQHPNADSFARGVADYLEIKEVTTISSPYGLIRGTDVMVNHNEKELS
jgi:adenylosuccinate synthase